MEVVAGTAVCPAKMRPQQQQQQQRRIARQGDVPALSLLVPLQLCPTVAAAQINFIILVGCARSRGSGSFSFDA